MQFLIDVIKELIRSYDLLKYLFLSDFKIRYQNKVLGFIWAILDPMLMMIIYIVLVGVIFQRGGPQYPVLLLSALLPWRWFSLSTANSTKVLITNAKLIQTVKISIITFPMNQVLLGLVNFLMGLVVLIPMLFIFHANVTVNILWVLPVIVSQFVFVTGCSLLVSFVGVYFRDLENVLQFVLKIGLYMSPVLYNVTMIPQQFQITYIYLNPFASLLNTYKNIFVRGLPPDNMFLIFVAYALILFLTGVYIFNKYQKNIAKDI